MHTNQDNSRMIIYTEKDFTERWELWETSTVLEFMAAELLPSRHGKMKGVRIFWNPQGEKILSS